jgi:hypothetical protein
MEIPGMANGASVHSSSLMVPEWIVCGGFGFTTFSRSFLTMDDVESSRPLVWGVWSVGVDDSSDSLTTGWFSGRTWTH